MAMNFLAEQSQSAKLNPNNPALVAVVVAALAAAVVAAASAVATAASAVTKPVH